MSPMSVIPQFGCNVHDHNPRAAFQEANADFGIASYKVQTFGPGTTIPYGDASPETVPAHTEPVVAYNRRLLVRTDTNTVIGNVSGTYTPVPNEALIQLFEALREDVTIENIALIENGAKIYISAFCNTQGEVTDGHNIRRNLVAFNSFNGTSRFGCFFTDVNTVCANQFSRMTTSEATAATAERRGLCMSHSASASAFAKKLPHIIDVSRQRFTHSLAELRELTKHSAPEHAKRTLLETVYADQLARPLKDRKTGKTHDRTIKDIPAYEAISTNLTSGWGMDAPGCKGTLYGLFQALTQYETHQAGRSKDPEKAARVRLEALYQGTAAARIEQARQILLAMV